VFFNFTAEHDFSILKAAPLISIFPALIYAGLNSTPRERVFKYVLNSLITLSIVLAVIGYLRVNYEKDPSFYKDIGEEIALLAGKDEVVFIKADDFRIDPQLIFYAGRNIAPWEDERKARELMAANGAERGIVFFFENGVMGHMRLGPPRFY